MRWSPLSEVLQPELQPIIFYHAFERYTQMQFTIFVLEWSCHGMISVNEEIVFHVMRTLVTTMFAISASLLFVHSMRSEPQT